MFQFAAFALHTYVFSMQCPVKAGFPHSEICGSKCVCSLPAAYRKLLRPSSPVIAKASTMCTYSLVPITLASPPTKRKDVTEIRVQRCCFVLIHTITTHRLTCRSND